MAFTTTTLSNLFRQKLDPVLHVPFPTESLTLDQFENGVKNEKLHASGRDFVFHTADNASFGSLTEAAQFPTPGSPQNVKGNITYTRQTKSGELSVDILEMASETDALEYAVGTDTEPGPVRRDLAAFRKVLNEFFYESNADGRLGVIATGGVSGTTITFGGDFAARKIPVGARVNWYDTGGTPKTTTTTTSVALSKSGSAVTFDAVPSNPLVATDFCTYENSYTRAPYSIPWFVDDTSKTVITGVATGTYTDVKGKVVDGSSQNITPGLIDLLVTKCHNQSGYSVPANDFKLKSHRAQQDKYRSQGYAQPRLVSNETRKLDLGLPMVAHNGMDWDSDMHCSPSDFYALRLKTWRVEYLTKIKTFEVGGEKLFLKPGSGTHYMALLYYFIAFYQVLCVNPGANGRIKSLNYDTNAV